MSILSQFKSILLLTTVIIGALFPSLAHAGQPDQQATITISSLNVNARVVELALTQNGWDTSTLGSRAGHLSGTPWLGESGNIVVGGHLEINGNPSLFYRLSSIQIGARITLSEGSLTQEYEVIETRIVEDHDVSILNATPDNRLTLLTCHNYDRQLRKYTQRFVVIAVPV